MKKSFMRVAYADPPYIGQANRYPEKQEVDHLELLKKLVEYDGWALSASSTSLPILIPIANQVTTEYRIGVWVKPFAIFKPNVNPAYAWEPLLFVPARAGRRDKKTVRDWVSANITLKKGVVGAKPVEFSWWLFDLLGMEPQDDFDDLFLGTGIVTKCWQMWKKADMFSEDGK